MPAGSPTLVQAQSGNSAALNPTIALTNPVTAGHLLVYACIEQGYTSTLPVPSDGVNQYFNFLGQAMRPSYTASVGYAYNVAAGSPVLSFPTSFPSAFLVLEFSNVLATSDPGDIANMLTQFGQQVLVPYQTTQKGELALLVGLSPDNTNFGVPQGQINAAQVQSANGSIAASYSVPNNATSGTLTLTVPANTLLTGGFASFLHA